MEDILAITDHDAHLACCASCAELHMPTASACFAVRRFCEIDADTRAHQIFPILDCELGSLMRLETITQVLGVELMTAVQPSASHSESVRLQLRAIIGQLLTAGIA